MSWLAWMIGSQGMVVRPSLPRFSSTITSLFCLLSPSHPLFLSASGPSSGDGGAGTDSGAPVSLSPEAVEAGRVLDAVLANLTGSFSSAADYFKVCASVFVRDSVNVAFTFVLRAHLDSSFRSLCFRDPPFFWLVAQSIRFVCV